MRISLLVKTKMATSGESRRGTTYVSFICQQCYQPLRLDYSFNTLDAETLSELTSSLPTSAEKRKATEEDEGASRDTDAGSEPEPKTESVNNATDSSEENVVTKTVRPTRMSSNDGNGFTLIGEASGTSGRTDNLSHRLKVSTRLFDILSSQSEVDHPLCEECTDTLLNHLDEELSISENELHNYRKFIEESENTKDDIDENELDAELEKLRKEENDLLNELEGIESERDKIKKEMDRITEEEAALKKQEEQYWKDYGEYQKQIADFENEQVSVSNQLQYAQAQLDKLRKTNVFNSTFHIWHKGHFGTINGFRLGRLPSVPVEWTEINAAWGQTVLLLHSLSKRIGMTFKKYRLVPYGNHSFIECIDDKMKELPLYGSGGFRFFWDTKFDQAMVAFLDCLQQFKEEVEKGDSGFYLPYRMEKGKIFDSRGSGSYSIKIQFNSEEHWTKALKFMLTNLKWGLAWVSSQFADKC